MVLSGSGPLSIPEAVAAQVLGHAIRDAPLEACGLLVGAGLHVSRFAPTENLARSAHRYTISAEDHFTALRKARLDGLDVIGAYHSHPDAPAVPSDTDRDLAFPGFVFLIAALRPDPHLRAWHLEGGNFTELLLVRT